MHRLFRLSNCGYNKVYISYHLQMNRLLPSLLLVLWGFLAFADDAYFQEQLAEARKGDPIAQFNMGIIYLKGDSAPLNHAEAVKWFRKAANQGVDAAQANLGLMYVTGDGVPKDNVKAFSWWSVAEKQGYNKVWLSNNLDKLIHKLTEEQLDHAQALATKYWESKFEDCD